MVQRTLIRPPASRLGAITPQERAEVMNQSPVSGQYDKSVDRESAFEMLQKRTEKATRAQQESEREEADASAGSGWTIPGFGDERPTSRSGRGARAPRASSRQTVTEAAIKSVVRSVGTSVGRAIVRGILGSLTRRR
jgi:hypothetical protein